MAMKARIRGVGSFHTSRENSGKNIRSHLQCQGLPGTVIILCLLSYIFLTSDGRTHETFWPETSTYPEVSYEDVMSKDESVLQWMEQIVSIHRGDLPDALRVRLLTGRSGNGGSASSRAFPLTPNRPRP